jgi:hypothetical protein
MKRNEEERRRGDFMEYDVEMAKTACTLPRRRNDRKSRVDDSEKYPLTFPGPMG